MINLGVVAAIHAVGVRDDPCGALNVKKCVCWYSSIIE